MKKVSLGEGEEFLKKYNVEVVAAPQISQSQESATFTMSFKKDLLKSVFFNRRESSKRQPFSIRSIFNISALTAA